MNSEDEEIVYKAKNDDENWNFAINDKAFDIENRFRS